MLAALCMRYPALRTVTHTDNKMERPVGATSFAMPMLAAALLLSVFVSPFASQAPDGLEAVAKKQGFAGSSNGVLWTHSPFADYRVSALPSEALSAGIAGGAGTLAVFGLLLSGLRASMVRRK